jgi:hypothetical protein
MFQKKDRTHNRKKFDTNEKLMVWDTGNFSHDNECVR